MFDITIYIKLHQQVHFAMHYIVHGIRISYLYKWTDGHQGPSLGAKLMITIHTSIKKSLTDKNDLFTTLGLQTNQTERPCFTNKSKQTHHNQLTPLE